MGTEAASADRYELLDLAVSAARRAAELVLAHRPDRLVDVGSKTTATDLVTVADQASEQLIVRLLRERRPGDQILGEEYGERAGEVAASAASPASPASAASPVTEAGVRWVVDPIDGTVNYVYGLPYYAVSIAAEVAGVSVAGVVHNVATGEEWTAVRGGGAWRAGQKLVCSQETELSQCLVATGFGYDAARRAHQATVLASVLPRVRDIRRFGAAAMDLCFAAEGRVDAYFERGLSPWDHAAGGLIAAEAGLRVGGLRGAEPGSAFVMAAPPALFPELHDLLVDLDADGGP